MLEDILHIKPKGSFVPLNRRQLKKIELTMLIEQYKTIQENKLPLCCLAPLRAK